MNGSWARLLLTVSLLVGLILIQVPRPAWGALPAASAGAASSAPCCGVATACPSDGDAEAAEEGEADAPAALEAGDEHAPCCPSGCDCACCMLHPALIISDPPAVVPAERARCAARMLRLRGLGLLHVFRPPR